MMMYEGSIWRPPSEARSLILQITIGCSKKQSCTFCVSYRNKKFRIKTLDEIEKNVHRAIQLGYGNAKRIFLADGNALVMKTSQLNIVLEMLYKYFPQLERVGIYSCASDILNKSVDELEQLKDSGLGLIYIGLETGDNFLLERIKKGVSAEENIKACLKVKEAQIPLSAIIILGLGGPKYTITHAMATASMIDSINPKYLAALTLMIPNGTDIAEDVQSGLFTPLSPEEILKELRLLVENMTKLNNTVFRTNHASNYLPLKGVLTRDRQKLLQDIDNALANPSMYFKPEYFRGL